MAGTQACRIPEISYEQYKSRFPVHISGLIPRRVWRWLHCGTDRATGHRSHRKRAGQHDHNAGSVGDGGVVAEGEQAASVHL